MTETKFLTQAELAQHWKISMRTLERWRWEGSGPKYIKIGNAVRYRIEDVLAYDEKAQ